MNDFISFFICVILITIIYIHFENKIKDVTYVVSKVDGRKYLVRNLDDKEESADLLAHIRHDLSKLTQYMKNQYKDDVDVDRMLRNFNPDNISETDKNSKYTSYSVNKGEKMVFCLRSRDDKNTLVKKNIMMFVALHELAHTMTKSIGHTEEFWNNFRRILKDAIKINIYNRLNYNENPVDYCGMKITDDPLNSE